MDPIRVYSFVSRSVVGDLLRVLIAFQFCNARLPGDNRSPFVQSCIALLKSGPLRLLGLGLLVMKVFNENFDIPRHGCDKRDVCKIITTE